MPCLADSGKFRQIPANSIEACPTPDGWCMGGHCHCSISRCPTLYYLVGNWGEEPVMLGLYYQAGSRAYSGLIHGVSQGYKGTYNSHAALLLPILGVNITYGWVIGEAGGASGFAFKGTLFPIAGQCRMGITSTRRFPTPDRQDGPIFEVVTRFMSSSVYYCMEALWFPNTHRGRNSRNRPL